MSATPKRIAAAAISKALSFIFITVRSGANYSDSGETNIPR